MIRKASYRISLGVATTLVCGNGRASVERDLCVNSRCLVVAKLAV